MLIAEDVLLLATDDATGKSTISSIQLDPALAGAVLIELVVAGRVNLQGEARPGEGGRRRWHPAWRSGARCRAAEPDRQGPAQARAAIRLLAKGLRARLNDLLEQRGILRRESGKVLGLFPTTRWPARDTESELEVRAQVVGALLKGQEPDGRAAAVISVLTAADMLKTVVQRSDIKAAKARGTEIAAGNWAGDGIRRVIQETQAAMTAAVMVSTTAAIAGGSS